MSITACRINVRRYGQGANVLDQGYGKEGKLSVRLHLTSVMRSLCPPYTHYRKLGKAVSRRRLL